MSRDQELADALKRDPRSAHLEPRPRAIIDYVLKLTREPWNVRREDLEPMRKTGLEDADILDVCQVACYYAYVNRLAQGLGVNLE